MYSLPGCLGISTSYDSRAEVSAQCKQGGSYFSPKGTVKLTGS